MASQSYEILTEYEPRSSIKYLISILDIQSFKEAAMPLTLSVAN